MSGAGPDKDYYSTLGAGESAPREEIERRYKRLARDHHPDRGGDEERMKAINEAWHVLGDGAARSAYDARRAKRRVAAYRAHAPVASPSMRADPVSGRVLGAFLCILVGLVLLFLVRVHYVIFLWPLALLAAVIVLFGVLMGHGALSFARSSVAPSHPARRWVWAQEIIFWSCVFAGMYGVFRILSAI